MKASVSQQAMAAQNTDKLQDFQQDFRLVI
jgi:hypothetical protein